MDDSPLQTALCLIGHPIGGNPTQFVVTRVLTSMQLDWQFLSFDVEPSQFAKAIAGIDALGFFGAMIAAPYRAEVADVLGHLYSEHEGVIEGINDSIFRGPDGKFVAVNLLSQALEQTLQAHQQASEQTCEQLICITDDEDLSGVLTQFQGALPAKQFIIRGTQFLRWPLVDPPTEAEPIQTQPNIEATTGTDNGTSPSVTSDEERSADNESVTDTPPHDPHAFDDQVATLVIWQVAGKPGRKTTHIGASSYETAKDALRKLPPGSVLVDLSCNYEAWLGRREFSTIHYISRVDLKLRRLALAIQSWTGREPNFEIMREAIEEYLEI